VCESSEEIADVLIFDLGIGPALAGYVSHPHHRRNEYWTEAA
jgi:hypothetical protein